MIEKSKGDIATGEEIMLKQLEKMGVE